MKKLYAALTLIPVFLLFTLNIKENPKNSFRDAPADLPSVDEIKSNISADIPMPAGFEKSKNETSQTKQDEAPLTMGPSAQQKSSMMAHNMQKSRGIVLSTNLVEPMKAIYRPYADYEATGHLIFTGEFRFQSENAKLTAAKNLPPGANLAVIVNPNYPEQKQQALKLFSQVLPKERIKFIDSYQTSNAFWTRDAMPIPVISLEDGSFTVIDALYYHRFNEDKQIADFFKAKLEKHDYYFEGGNFMANHKGACIIINHGQHTLIPDSIFLRYYGCENVIRLPFKDGIGHIDEHVRFVNESLLLTDIPEYKTELEQKGFKASLLPKPNGPFETYVNSLIMDGKAVVPIFNKSTDAEALKVYESVGLKAEGAFSSVLSNSGQGSVHCITMTYPAK